MAQQYIFGGMLAARVVTTYSVAVNRDLVAPPFQVGKCKEP